MNISKRIMLAFAVVLFVGGLFVATSHATVTSTDTYDQFTGDGVTLDYPFTFNLLTDLNASVEVTPSDVGVYFGSVLQSTSNYTVNGPYGSPANTVILNPGTAPVEGTIITVVRTKPQTQSSRFLDNVAMPASSWELALDKLTMEVQQLQTQIDYAPVMPFPQPIGAPPVPLALPIPGANQVIGWNNTGTALALFPNAVQLAGAAPVCNVLTGSTPSVVPADVTLPIKECSTEVLSGNTTLTLPASSSAPVIGWTTHLIFTQPSGSHDYTLAVSAGAGTAVKYTTGCSGGLPSMPTGTGHSVLLDIIYNNLPATPEWDVLSCVTTGA